MSRKAAELGQDLAAWQAESMTGATNLQVRLTNFHRQVLQKALDSERQKTDLENLLHSRTTNWAQAKAELERQLAARTADTQALQEALAKALAENKERLGLLRVMLLWRAAGTRPPAVGAVIWDKSLQRGLFLAENLSPPPLGRDHQLWLHDPRYPVPISAGVLPDSGGASLRFDFKPTFPIEQLTRAELSIERKGGTDTRQGRVVMESR
jgi:anti-sigma-K factor RskA